MKHMKMMLVTLGILVAGLGVSTPALAAPADVLEQGGCTGNTTLCGNSGDGVFTVIRSVISVLLVVAGIIAVIMIIVGGIQFSTSAGDPAHTKKAKDTVLYSIVGLVVSVMAYVIVNFVLTEIK